VYYNIVIYLLKAYQWFGWQLAHDTRLHCHLKNMSTHQLLYKACKISKERHTLKSNGHNGKKYPWFLINRKFKIAFFQIKEKKVRLAWTIMEQDTLDSLNIASKLLCQQKKLRIFAHRYCTLLISKAGQNVFQLFRQNTWVSMFLF